MFIVWFHLIDSIIAFLIGFAIVIADTNRRMRLDKSGRPLGERLCESMTSAVLTLSVGMVIFIILATVVALIVRPLIAFWPPLLFIAQILSLTVIPLFSVVLFIWSIFGYARARFQFKMVRRTARCLLVACALATIGLYFEGDFS